MGDVRELAGSIRELGLLHPIVVRPDGRLIAGERRLRAAKLLGWTEIPVTVVDLDVVAKGELAENAHRKDFLPSEIDAIRRALEPTEKAAAKARMIAGGKGVKLSHPSRATDKIGAFAGVSGRTVEKIKAVCEAAKQEPARFGHLVAELDRYRGVDRAHRMLRRTRDEVRVLSLQPRDGKYRTLVVDVPWECDNDPFGRSSPQYALLTHEQALALPISGWAEDNCHIYLWVTNTNLPIAVKCMEAWGFQHKSVITWIKPPPFGLGVYFRGSTELCLFGVRGQLMTRSNSIATHFEAPRGAHSEKPEKFYEIVRAASYPPYGEAFQRTTRDDFINLYTEKHGDDAPYDPADDMSKGVDACLEAVRERKARGGPGWPRDEK